MKLTLKQALFISLLFFIFYFFSYPEVDPDLWGHLFFGREIVQNDKLPLQNLYSFTAPDHPWINHEWLAEVIFYEIFSLFGSPGLILLKVTIGAMIVWILDLIIKKRAASPFARVLTLVWIMAILSPGFNIRPQLFTYLFFAIFVFLFYRYDEGKKRILYWAPPLMALWVNLHGGFVAGLGALGLFSLWTAMTRGRSRGVGTTTAHAFLPLALSVLSLGLNPYGVNLLKFLWKDLLLDRPITEWGPVPFLDFSFLEFKLAFLFFLLIFMRRNSFHRWDFILAVLAALFSVRYQRHMPLFAIAVAPFLAQGIQRASHCIERGARDRIFAAGLFVVALYLLFSIGRVHLQHRFQLVVSSTEYPTQAADFLKRNGIKGNLAVPFDWGEYLIWKLYPDVRVSIDGRYTTAYPMELIQEHWDWMEGKEGWRKLLERYPTEIAVTSRYHPVSALLRNDPEWVYIYSDPVAFVFVRKTASQEHLLAKFRDKGLVPPRPTSIYFPG